MYINLYMRKQRRIITDIALAIIFSFLYSNIVLALPNLKKESLHPQSALVKRVASLDVQAAMLLSDLFHKTGRS